MRLLDLFCGAGGAAMGYHRAGFDEIVGVDIKPQPNYPFEFVQADAMEYPLAGFDAIHASPPCQRFSAMRVMHNALEHGDALTPTRQRLLAAQAPYVIENVPGAPLRDPVRLCGSMFGLGVADAELRRHRLFEASFAMLQPRCAHGAGDTIGVRRVIGIYGKGARDSRRKSDRGVPDFTANQGREAMGIDWMSITELSQAIPPAYTEWIGRQLIAQIRAAA